MKMINIKRLISESDRLKCLTIILLYLFITQPNNVFSQSKKDKIAALTFSLDSTSQILEKERNEKISLTKELSQKKSEFERQIEDSRKTIAEQKKQIESKTSLNNQLDLSIKEKVKENKEITALNLALRDSISNLSLPLSVYKLSVNLFIEDRYWLLAEDHNRIRQRLMSPEVDLMTFTDGWGVYQIFVNKENSEIRFNIQDYNEVIDCIIRDSKVIVGINHLAANDQTPTDLYKVEKNELCAYNPEEDGYNCYTFQRNQSTCDLSKYFK